jgi:hypothetical protein
VIGEKSHKISNFHFGYFAKVSCIPQRTGEISCQHRILNTFPLKNPCNIERELENKDFFAATPPK